MASGSGRDTDDFVMRMEVADDAVANGGAACAVEVRTGVDDDAVRLASPLIGEGDRPVESGGAASHSMGVRRSRRAARRIPLLQGEAISCQGPHRGRGRLVAFERHSWVSLAPITTQGAAQGGCLFCMGIHEREVGVGRRRVL